MIAVVINNVVDTVWVMKRSSFKNLLKYIKVEYIYIDERRLSWSEEEIVLVNILKNSAEVKEIPYILDGYNTLIILFS